jgi:ubiquinone/menaquinone biosynthesis C-methylase UbiE
MDKKNEQLENQRKTWDQFSAGWKKWDDMLMKEMNSIGETLINSLAINAVAHVLDVAAGTGEPGLTLSSRLPKGRVTGCDLSEEMVSIANEFAASRNISNYHCITCSADDMDFEDNTFDAVICRFGIMFFPDIDAGLKEMIRVMKPGSTLAAAVWATPDLNPFISTMAETVHHRLDLPKPPEDSPGIFRCAQPGFTGNLLQSSGLIDVDEFNLKGEIGFESPEHYWQVMSDIAGPIMHALNQAPKEIVMDVKSDVLNKAVNFTNNDKIRFDWNAIIATGVKL